MITFLATVKEWRPPASIVQANAIGSWLRSVPDAEVLVFGSRLEDAAKIEALGARCIGPHSQSAEPPTLEAMLAGETNARHDTIAFANADIILLPGLAEAVGRVRNVSPRFVVTGHRTTLSVAEEIDFGASWAADWTSRAAQGIRQPGTDYFIFPKGLFRNVPPFTIGAEWWNNWLLFAARHNRAIVVDASEVILAIHQDHSRPSNRPKSQEWSNNRMLLGGPGHAFLTPEATHLMDSDNVRLRCRSCYPACVCDFAGS